MPSPTPTRTFELAHLLVCCIKFCPATHLRNVERQVFDGITLPSGFGPDIYNYEPQLGFYCLYRPRPGENATANSPKCPNITGVARQHAEWL